MSPCRCVLGCAGLCWVGFCDLAQVKASSGAGLRGVLRVCWVFRRACACASFFCLMILVVFFSNARDEKPSKPSTPSTGMYKSLFLKGSSCAGFVLTSVVMCRVWISEGVL